MGFIFTGVFWGIFLIFIGLVIVIREVFGVHIPIFRLAFAFLLIYLGISLLFGRSMVQSPKNTVLFNETKIDATQEFEHYDIVFSKANIDLLKIQSDNHPNKVKINTVFGSAMIKINPELPIKIKINSMFAEAKLPDGNDISFGNYVYKTPSYSENGKSLQLEANVVFGSIEFVTK